MGFPVFVASDVDGTKVNLVVHYNPHTSTLSHLLSTASLWFDEVARRWQRQPPPPFVAAYVFRDVQRQWDALEDCTQLSPCCQLYIFRDTAAEVVGEIPDPVDPADLVAARRTSHASPTPPNSASPAPRPPPLLRLASDRWALPHSSPRASPPRRAHTPDAQAAPARRLDKGTATVADEAAHSDGRGWATDVSMSFHPLRSHRFRLQIVSPAAEPWMRSRGDSDPVFRVTASTTSGSSPGLTPTWTPRRRTSIGVGDVTHTNGRGAQERDVTIPPSWYDPSRHSHPRATPATRETPPHAVARPPSGARSSAEQPLPSTLARAHGSSRTWRTTVSTRAPDVPRRRAGSILREERDRVEARMRMEMDELRSSLQEENRQLQRTLSGSLHRCTTPLSRAQR